MASCTARLIRGRAVLMPARFRRARVRNATRAPWPVGVLVEHVDPKRAIGTSRVKQRVGTPRQRCARGHPHRLECIDAPVARLQALHAEDMILRPDIVAAAAHEIGGVEQDGLEIASPQLRIRGSDEADDPRGHGRRGRRAGEEREAIGDVVQSDPAIARRRFRIARHDVDERSETGIEMALFGRARIGAQDESGTDRERKIHGESGRRFDTVVSRAGDDDRPSTAACVRPDVGQRVGEALAQAIFENDQAQVHRDDVDVRKADNVGRGALDGGAGKKRAIAAAQKAVAGDADLHRHQPVVKPDPGDAASVVGSGADGSSHQRPVKIPVARHLRRAIVIDGVIGSGQIGGQICVIEHDAGIEGRDRDLVRAARYVPRLGNSQRPERGLRIEARVVRREQQPA